MAIEVDDLRKTYQDGWLSKRRIDALRGVSLAVAPGEIFGLLGPNGAGKTTLIKVLLGLVGATSGRAKLLGHSIGDRAGRRSVGYLPEGHRFPQHHTGNSALEYFGGLSGLAPSVVRSRAPALLEMVGLSTWGKTPVRKYSKGMQQRLGLAQAMLHEPQVLMLDEPTDGVDPVGRKEMRVLLQQIKAQGKTIFINSHLLQEVELVCDRVAILTKGEVRRMGTIEEFTKGPRDEFTFAVLADEASLRSALSGEALADVHGSGPNQIRFTIAVADQQVVDRVVDSLRRANLSITSITGQRRTLEDAFLEIVGGRPAGGAGPNSPISAAVPAGGVRQGDPRGPIDAEVIS
jgi:ABC-2 type transport system ATP-binding protein